MNGFRDGTKTKNSYFGQINRPCFCSAKKKCASMELLTPVNFSFMRSQSYMINNFSHFRNDVVKLKVRLPVVYPELYVQATAITRQL